VQEGTCTPGRQIRGMPPGRPEADENPVEPHLIAIPLRLHIEASIALIASRRKSASSPDSKKMLNLVFEALNGGGSGNYLGRKAGGNLRQVAYQSLIVTSECTQLFL